jgi:hypothetical protein
MDGKMMRKGQILLKGKVWVQHVELAATTWQRMRGLLGRRELPAGQGMLIDSCGSIHTVGMRFAIDVVFLDRTWRICRVCQNVRPGCLATLGGWRAARTLEVGAGWLDLSAASPGVILEWSEAHDS